MSKARGSSFFRKAKRLHVDPFNGIKFRVKTNNKFWIPQVIIMRKDPVAGQEVGDPILDKYGNIVTKTIWHRKDGVRYSDIIQVKPSV